MPETCKKLLGFVNSCVYYANQTHDIYQVLSYSVDFKGPEEIDWVRQYLMKVGLFRIKDLSKSEITAKLKSNLYVQPVDIFHNFWHCLCQFYEQKLWLCVWQHFCWSYMVWQSLVNIDTGNENHIWNLTVISF